MEDFKKDFISFVISRGLDPKDYERNLKIFHKSRMRALDKIDANTIRKEIKG